MTHPHFFVTSAENFSSRKDENEALVKLHNEHFPPLAREAYYIAHIVGEF